MVLNTENAKVHSLDGGIDMDVPLTEERLGDELLHLKVDFCLNCYGSVLVFPNKANISRLQINFNSFIFC